MIVNALATRLQITSYVLANDVVSVRKVMSCRQQAIEQGGFRFGRVFFFADQTGSLHVPSYASSEDMVCLHVCIYVCVQYMNISLMRLWPIATRQCFI